MGAISISDNVSVLHLTLIFMCYIMKLEIKEKDKNLKKGKKYFSMIKNMFNTYYAYYYYYPRELMF